MGSFACNKTVSNQQGDAMTYPFIFITAILFGFNTLAQENKVSLQDAIQYALKNNPRTQANTLRLQSAFEQLQAYKQSKFLPTASVSYSQDLQNRSTKSAQAAINLNLFNGFADYYSIKAQECNYKLSESNLKSTNSQMQNTSGQIVGLVANNYINLVEIRQNQYFDKMTLEKLNQILPYSKNEEQKNTLENYISGTAISLQESVSDLQIAEANYKYVVNAEAPPMTDTFSDIMEKIEIPQNTDIAFNVSLEKSPEILSAKLSLECNQLSRKAERASLYSARVDLSATRSTDFNGNNNGTTSAQLNITIPFDLGRIKSYKAEEKNMTATQLDLDDTIAQIKNDLNNNYIRLQSSQDVANTYEINYKNTGIKINNYMSNLKNLSLEEINILINLLRTQQGQFYQLNSKKQTVINLKYSIQRNIGTLFDVNRFTFQ
jgi:outer membrane protein TolC